MGDYSTLFTFVTEHDFYESGLAHGLGFIPTVNTAHVIGNAGLLIKPVAGGIAVLYDRKNSESLQLYAEDKDEPLNLVFKVYADDAVFKSLTDISVETNDGVLFFDNHQRENIVNDRIMLHGAKNVSTIDTVMLESNQLEGVLGHRERRKLPLFVLNIQITEKDLSAVDDNNKAVPKNYAIKFGERQIFWKYYLLGQLAKENMLLSDLDGVAKFVFMGKALLDDRREAMIFRTAERLSLKACSHYRFQLRERGSGGEKVIIKRLPVAKAMHLGRDVIDGRSEVVSEIYINC
ncbi:MAG: hypothetical protein L3J98_09125 [Gammaproteobacteria bacterium]|nr:hypothetical protein [Gammaproteobacteria bacterium]MCF6260303.1 hypothetical protein [Gammaproteobacteria bacterium]